MLRFLFVAIAALETSQAALAAPEPPPPPEQVAFLRNFFDTLPKRLPPLDAEKLVPLVAEEVKVYRSGKLAFDGRNQWLAHLNSFGGKTPDEPQGLSVSREAFYRTASGGIMVLEFAHPLAPKGKEGQVAYHPADPFRMVTYHFDAGRLVRVDYGEPMRRYDYVLRERPASQ